MAQPRVVTVYIDYKSPYAPAAKDAGILGVPTLVIDGELFRGSEHLPDIRQMLADQFLEQAS